MFNSLPRSLWFFVATALIFLLQTSPFPGLYLMFLMAPLWSIAIINAGFIFLGIEVLTGKTYKVWLVAPLAWFLGYGYVAWKSHRTVKVLEQQVSAFNGQRRIAFDPVKQSLAIDSGFYRDNDFVRTLLEGYDLQVVYVANRGSRPVTHTAWRVSRTEDCMSINDSHRFKTTILGVPLTAHYGLYPQLVANTCFCGTSEEPPSPAVTYSVTARAEKRLGYLEYSLNVVTLRDNSGSAEFQSVLATPYTWYPAPAMGCGLNSGNPSWDCHAAFLKDRSVWVVAKPADTIARALPQSGTELGLPTSHGTPRRISRELHMFGRRQCLWPIALLAQPVLENGGSSCVPLWALVEANAFVPGTSAQA